MTLGPQQDIASLQEQSVQIPLELWVRHAGSDDAVTLHGGICLPRGYLREASAGTLQTGPAAVPAQLEPLNRWSDGSVRWMTVSSVLAGIGVPNAIRVPAQLTTTPRESPQGERLTQVRTLGQAILVTQQQIDAENPVEARVRVEPVLYDARDQRQEVTFSAVRQESSGPIRRVMVVSGFLTDAPYITLQFRIEVWPGTGLVQVESRIRNTRRARHPGGLWDLGDAGSWLLRSLELRITNSTLGVPLRSYWSAHSGEPLQWTPARHPTVIRQFGSGGENWNSSNHVDADGKNPVRKRGYELQLTGNTVVGDRAEPVFAIEAREGYLAVTVPEFWQQFPGELTVENNVITCGLFPADEASLHELQGGEQKTRSVWIRSGPGAIPACCLSWLASPPRLMQSPDWYEHSEVFPWFPGPLTQDGSDSRPPSQSDAASFRYSAYLREATGGAHSVQARREVIDEYGWRNFGDIHADHEQLHYDGPETVISHYNNQFDVIFGGILNLAATGEPEWFELFDAMARHVMDIDLYHTAQDRSVWNGGLFWHTDHYVDARSATHRTYSRHNRKPGRPYGGGPCSEHNYTTGLLHYFFLTGHPEARESVLSLAEWVLNMDDGACTPFGLLDDGPSGYATHTVSADYHGPGRGSGNSLNALLDAWILTRSPRYLNKAEELIRRCVHPEQDIDALHLLDAERHWSYTVYLTALGRYLLLKAESDQRDAMYSYARSTLSRFGRWMVAHERPTLSQPDQLEFPTEAWAAQDFRKANVLRIAASCEDNRASAAEMRARADALNDAAWDGLYAFGQQHLTARCLSILMTEGQRDVFHRRNSDQQIPPGPLPPERVPWTPFVSQRTRVRRMLKSPRGIAVAACRALNPLRLVRAGRSVLRQL